MASSVLISTAVILTTCIVAAVIAESRHGNFPLKGCTETDIDLLSLFHYDIDQPWLPQKSLITYMTWLIIFPTPSVERSGWMVAYVLDQFSAHNRTVDAKGWNFQTLSNHSNEAFMDPLAVHLEIPTKDINTVLELKIQSIERLFDEMSGVRENASHVGVVFLDGSSLTGEEIRNVSSIVQQRNEEDVKIFVVIFSCNLVEEIVHLTDTLVLPDRELGYFDHYLLMAMCKSCVPSALLFEHKTSINMLSCFHVLSDVYATKWTAAMSECNKYYNGHLPVIETVEELQFLQIQSYKIIEQYKINQTKVQISIGLRRDLRNFAKPFQWETAPGRYRPLLIQHWLPGKPCKGCANKDCVVWEFNNPWVNDSSNVFKNVTAGKRAQSDGWTDVSCHVKISQQFVVCELALPRQISDVDFIRNIPAPTDNNLTLEKGNFLIYETNIVSVSANVGNTKFLQFLRDSKKDFPVYDCGEGAGNGSYISYSMVCDFTDDCSNKRDELSCLTSRGTRDNTEMYCTSGQKLKSSEYQCDNVKHCRDRSDEVNCFPVSCKSVRCLGGSCLSLQWVKDGQFDCLVYMNSSSDLVISDESPLANLHLINNKSCALVCNRDICIDESQLNDNVTDCTGPEGPLDETIGKLEAANTCRNTFGHFIWAPKCHYIKDRYGSIIGCRDMSHLKDCENFECGNGYVKCYNSYCIPHQYLRNGKADCPTGEDENLFYTGPCTGYFACWDSKICLYPELVCDGHPHCPHDDDELDCHVGCPEGLRCVAGTVTLSNYNRSVPLNIQSLSPLDRQTRYMDLSEIELHGFDEFPYELLEIFHNLKVLILSKCNISQVYKPQHDSSPKYRPRSMIQILDISYNKFEIFSYQDYNLYYKNIVHLNMSFNLQLTLVKDLKFSFLEILDLSGTSISYLNDSVFAKLPRLKHLNLSQTLISDFTRQYFRAKMTLQTLDLRGILTEDNDDYLFHGLTISQVLYTDHFQICCPQIQDLIIQAHACKASVDADAISSCFNLLGLRVQRYLIWIVAVLAVLGNVTVIVYRVIWDRSVFKTGYGLFVTNLGISDFIMGVYLFIIAGADYSFRDNYVFYDKNWRNSDVCKIAGFMACLSCEASTFFVFFITLDRFLVMKFPFGHIKCSRLLKTIAVIMSWVTSFLLSLIPILFSFDIYSSNAMCLGLPLTNTQANGWMYAIGVFIMFNLIMFLLVAYGQYAIFRAMTENRIPKTATSMSRSRRAEDITVAKQLSLVALSNFLLWFPVGLMGLISLGGHQVSSEVYAWTTVILLPINSAANPVLYTIPALMARWEKFKHEDQKTHSATV